MGATDGREVIIRNNSRDIAKATLEILENEKLAEKIAENARHLVEERFSWYKMSEYLDEIYEKTYHEKA